MASQHEIQEALNKNGYGDWIDDLVYIFRKKFKDDEIASNIKIGIKEFGKERTWKEIILELRLSKIGKMRSYTQTSGIRASNDSMYLESARRYYKVLSRNFASAGVDLEFVEKQKNDVMRVLNLKKGDINL